jgi:hypothetical protein
MAFSGDNTIKLVKTLIRYDIPFLLLGKSSIGKSYSIIEMANRYRIPHNILYIGSEKPSNIEGLPRLTGERTERGDVLEFFKPNWFPNEQLITEYVRRGKEVFDRYVTDYLIEGSTKKVLAGADFPTIHKILESLFYFEWDSETTSEQNITLYDVSSKEKVMVSEVSDLPKLNTKAFPVKRTIQKVDFSESEQDVYHQDDVRDLSLYLTTLCGYGNFWLVLDELDKVDKREQDKYAPLLHIVRERTIKNFSFRTLNEGKGAGVPQKVSSSKNYSKVKEALDQSIMANLPLLDGRIIGIANATKDIEDALFRRFCHLVVEDVMMVTSPPKEMSKMRACLKSVNEALAQNEGLAKDLKLKFIGDVNLQWQFGFFPKMVNSQDKNNNFIYTNLLNELKPVMNKLGDVNAYKKTISSNAQGSALAKIISNNFAYSNDERSPKTQSLREEILVCLLGEMFDTNASYEAEDSLVVTEGEAVETIEDVNKKITLAEIQELKDKGLSAKEIARELADKVQDEIDKIKTLDPSAFLSPQIAFNELFNLSARYLKYTMFEDETGGHSEISQHLLPMIVSVVYSGILTFVGEQQGSKQTMLDSDAKENLIRVFQSDVLKPIYNDYVDAITFNSETTRDEFYGSDTSMYGTGDAESYMKSISGAIARNHTTELIEILNMLTRNESETTKFQEANPMLFKYVKDNFSQDLLDHKIRLYDKLSEENALKNPSRMEKIEANTKVSDLETLKSEWDNLSPVNQKRLHKALSQIKERESRTLGLGKSINTLSKLFEVEVEKGDKYITPTSLLRKVMPMLKEANKRLKP